MLTASVSHCLNNAAQRLIPKFSDNRLYLLTHLKVDWGSLDPVGWGLHPRLLAPGGWPW